MNDNNTPGNSQQNRRRQIQTLRADLIQQTRIHENIIETLIRLQAELDDLRQQINNIRQGNNSTSSSSKEEKSKKR